ncbi:MAG: two-component system regulatory protein YycI [Thermovenabulum sp.]|uniref:two-component system regulatory protein YycI n=1 Tax=Thermovenabulum sp. TaxID=3100335 RepID=UPI003C7AE445
MDWKKAVTILIASFFLLNVFMVANLYLRDVYNKKITSLNTSQEVLKFLKEKGITVKEKFPTKGIETFWLEVMPVEKIIIEDYNQEISRDFKNIDLDKAKRTAEKFILDKIGMPSNACFFKAVFDDLNEEYDVVYIQEYKNFPIFNSFIKVRILESGKIILEKNWLEIEGFKGKKREVILPVVALLKVAELKGQDNPIAVSSIKQGYYAKPVNAEKWQIPPVWRIELEDGETFYINGYTGEAE